MYIYIYTLLHDEGNYARSFSTSTKTKQENVTRDQAAAIYCSIDAICPDIQIVKGVYPNIEQSSKACGADTFKRVPSLLLLF